jgi:hypothetical protein
MKRVLASFVAFLTVVNIVAPILEVEAQRRGGSRSTSVSRSRSTTTVKTKSTYSGGVRQTQVRSGTVSSNHHSNERALVVGEDGFAAKGERGTVVVGEEGGYARGEQGFVAAGEKGFVAAGEERFVAVGEEAFGYRGEGGTIILIDEMNWGEYEPFHGGEEYWKFVAGATTILAIGAMFTSLPTSYETIVVGSSSYYYYDHCFYSRIHHHGQVTYQVIRPPIGGIVRILPPGCATVTVRGVNYHHWAQNNVYYARSGSSYRIVVKP